MITHGEWNFALALALLFYFIYAVAVARREKFMFGDRDFHIGPPDFLHFNGQFRLQKGYHLPMAIEFLSIGIVSDLLIWNFSNRLAGITLFSISALIVEDMFYYINNPFDKPDTSESITDAFGFLFGVPVLWLAGLLYTAVASYFLL